MSYCIKVNIFPMQTGKEVFSLYILLDTPQCSEGWQNVSQVATPGKLSKLTCQVDSWPSTDVQMDWSVLLPGGKEIDLADGDSVTIEEENVVLGSHDETKFNDDEQRKMQYSTQNLGSQSSTPNTHAPVISKTHPTKKSFSRLNPLSNDVIQLKRFHQYPIHGENINVLFNYTTESVVVLCRARNAVGIQKVPCRIHLSQTEIPPVSLLTSVSAESAKSFLNCSSNVVSSLEIETIYVSCSMAADIEKVFKKFSLQGWKNNNTLAWNASR